VAADILGSRKISIVGADFKGLGQSELRKWGGIDSVSEI
jgi:hypothetical protein